jgi:quinolinate synthase
VVKSLNSDRVIFIPDEYLAANVARETGKKIIYPTRDPVQRFVDGLDYQMIGWPGRCEVHDKFTVEDIANVRKQFSRRRYPGASGM